MRPENSTLRALYIGKLICISLYQYHNATRYHHARIHMIHWMCLNEVSNDKLNVAVYPLVVTDTSYVLHIRRMFHEHSTRYGHG